MVAPVDRESGRDGSEESRPVPGHTLAHTLARNGHSTGKITAAARATFGIADHVRVIQRSQLRIAVEADGLGELELTQAAELAGRYCPVSNTLGAGGVELDVAAHTAALVPTS